MNTKFKNFKNKKVGYILFLLVFIVIIVIFNLISSRNFIINEVNSDYQLKDPSTSVHLDWNTTIISNSENGGRDITVDMNNSVYIVGEVLNSTKGAFDILIMKYNHMGNQLWNRTWGGESDDYGNSISIDGFGNIFVVGATNSLGNNSSDIVILKYNNLGQLEWNETWGGAEWDSAFGLTFDEEGNIFVVGFTESYSALGDIILLKFSSSGSLLLNKTYGGLDTDCAYDIESDLEGNLYFTGYTCSFGAETSDFLLVKINKNGEHLWNLTYGHGLPTIGTDLIVDSLNNVLVVANTQNSGTGHDFIVSKINSSGDFLWNFSYSSPDYDFGYSIDLDSKENIFITGQSEENLILVKLDQTGNKKWGKLLGDKFIYVAYGIVIDQYDNIFITGITKNSENELKTFLLKFSPIPDIFILTSDAMKPDPDGNFTLFWEPSIDANNYSLYQSNKTISKINGTIIELINGTTNKSYPLKNLEEGTYYFLVVAYNKYGNTISNCFKIRVQFPPDEFTLNNITQIPNTNGIVNLTWNESRGATNYSIYVHDTYIFNVTLEGTLAAEGINTTFYLIKNLTNDDYYYVIVAINEAGQIISNCIHVRVRRVPTSFELISDAGQPDGDGNFELIWTKSEFAQNYIIYIINQSSLNNTIQILYNFTPSFHWPSYRYKITGWNNGTYNFQVIAFNQYGSSETEWLEVKVSIPKDSSNQNIGNTNNFPIEIIQQVIISSLFIGLLGGLIFIYMKKRSK